MGNFFFNKNRIIFVLFSNFYVKLKLYLNYKGFFLKWKPLFKKSSYFGIYRATKNQFLNK